MILKNRFSRLCPSLSMLTVNYGLNWLLVLSLILVLTFLWVLSLVLQDSWRSISGFWMLELVEFEDVSGILENVISNKWVFVLIWRGCEGIRSLSPHQIMRLLHHTVIWNITKKQKIQITTSSIWYFLLMFLKMAKKKKKERISQQCFETKRKK